MHTASTLPVRFEAFYRIPEFRTTLEAEVTNEDLTDGGISFYLHLVQLGVSYLIPMDAVGQPILGHELIRLALHCHQRDIQEAYTRITTAHPRAGEHQLGHELTPLLPVCWSDLTFRMEQNGTVTIVVRAIDAQYGTVLRKLKGNITNHWLLMTFFGVPTA